MAHSFVVAISFSVAPHLFQGLGHVPFAKLLLSRGPVSINISVADPCTVGSDAGGVDVIVEVLRFLLEVSPSLSTVGDSVRSVLSSPANLSAMLGPTPAPAER